MDGLTCAVKTRHDEKIANGEPVHEDSAEAFHDVAVGSSVPICDLGRLQQYWKKGEPPKEFSAETARIVGDSEPFRRVG
jgi:hypothetical protein